MITSFALSNGTLTLVPLYHHEPAVSSVVKKGESLAASPFFSALITDTGNDSGYPQRKVEPSRQMRTSFQKVTFIPNWTCRAALDV
jgi:hypothetical protein